MNSQAPCTVPSKVLRSAFEGRVRELQRFAKSCWLNGLAEKVGRCWMFSPDAVLPNGMRVRDYAQNAKAVADIVAESPKRNAYNEERQRQIVLEAETRRSRLRDANPELGVLDLHRLFVERNKDWAESNGISLEYAAYRRRVRKIQKGEVLLPRGRRRLDSEALANRLCPQAQALAAQLYAKNPSWSEVHRVLLGRASIDGLTVPTNERSFRRYVKRLRLAKKDELTLVRKGPDAFRRDCLPKIERDYNNIESGEILVGDGHILDVYVLHRGKRVRPILIAWMDLRSRMIVGVELSATENTDAIIRCTQTALIRHGLPDAVIVDSSKGYKAAGFRRMKAGDPASTLLQQLGIRVHNCMPHSPWAKPIERHFRNVAEGFSRWFDSHCGNRPENRPFAAHQVPLDELPTFERIEELLGIYVDEINSRTGHRGKGMDGLSPAQAFERFRYKPRRKASDEVIRGYVTRTVERVVRRDGLKINGVLYGNSDPEVWKLQGQKVLVRIDATRVDCVDLWDPETGEFLTVATNKRLSGATKDDLRESNAKLRKYSKGVRNRAKQLDRLELPEDQILIAKRDAAKAQEAALEKKLPAAATVPLTIVAADKVKGAKQATKKRAAKDRSGFERPSKESGSYLEELVRLQDETEFPEQEASFGMTIEEITKVREELNNAAG